MSRSSSLQSVLAEVEDLAARDNLGAVLIHLNDTYFIDERPPNIPGMPRVAGLIHTVRATVRRLVGEDRTLVVHSGDYLSPSGMSRLFKGAQMIDVLNCCGIDFATLGNHEFDFGPDVLWSRLAAAKWTNIVSNLQAPDGHSLKKLALWPHKEPFLAIAGIVGDQTRAKALKAGFKAAHLTDPEEVVAALVDEIRQHSGVGALVVLSHMDRLEDKLFQELLSRYWDKYGYVYLLGGHDHDIFWREHDRPNAILSKNKSNNKSITVILVPKDGMASPYRDDATGLNAPSPPREVEMQYRAGTGVPPFPSATQEELLEKVLNGYRRISAGVRPDFRTRFESAIREAFEDRGAVTNLHDEQFGVLESSVLDTTSSYVHASGFVSCAREISSHDDLFGLPIDPLTQQRVASWQARVTGQHGPTSVVADFSGCVTVPPEGLDATDASLRWRSTDFGNFVADAVKVVTAVDVVLLNAGAFRIDAHVPAVITSSDLSDVFVFDGPETIAIVELSRIELLKFYDHAIHQGGHGAFLQVSETRSTAASREEPIRVALVAHMLQDHEDGYRSILASLRGATDTADWRKVARPRLLADGIVTLIVQGAVSGIVYSSGNRLEGVRQTERCEEYENRLAPVVERYRAAATAANITEYDSRLILRGFGYEIPLERRRGWDTDALPKVRSIADELRTLVRAMFFDVCGLWSRDAFDAFDAFHQYLRHAPRTFRFGVPYYDYLADASDFHHSVFARSDF